MFKGFIDAVTDILEDIEDDMEIFPSNCIQNVRSSFSADDGGVFLQPPHLVSLVQGAPVHVPVPVPVPVPVHRLGARVVKIKILSSNFCCFENI